MPNDAQTKRIEELELALEGLVECFEPATQQERPTIEVEVDDVESNGLVWTEGFVSESVAEALVFAEDVLYFGEAGFDSEGE